jgi:hypothetical protein
MVIIPNLVISIFDDILEAQNKLRNFKKFYFISHIKGCELNRMRIKNQT